MTDLTSEERAELRAVCDEGFTVGHDEWLDLSAAALLALLDAADERDRLAAAIERVQKLADDWHSRGEHLMAYSKTLPDEISDALLESGAEFVERARLLRIALADPDGCMTTTEGDPTC